LPGADVVDLRSAVVDVHEMSHLALDICDGRTSVVFLRATRGLADYKFHIVPEHTNKLKMKIVHVVLFVVVFASALLLVDAKKKKKSDDVDNKRPTTVEALLYCNACQAIVREVLKKVKDSKKEYDVHRNPVPLDY
jgi:hypothetical protein